MAESYNAIAIKMGIDTSQFDAGLRRTQKQIDDVAARMAKASEENRQRARMAGGMAGMGVGVTPEDRRLSEQIATRLKINQIINQQNQLFEQNRARQQAINAETERYNRVTSTLLVNMIRRTEQESIDNRQLAKRINANLTLNKIYDQQAAALSLRAQKEAALENSARTKRLIDANKVLTQIYQQQEAALALRAQKEEALAQQAKTERIIQSNRIITEIYRQQNQLLELKRDIQKSIDAEAEKERKILEYLNKNWEHHLQVQQRLRVVRSTEIADQIRANELAAIADRRLAERINANLTLNKIYNQQAEALARRTSKQEVAQAERLFQVETSRVLQSQELVANEERIRSLREDILARAAAEASRLGEEQKVAQAERLFQVETSRAIKSEEQLANEERIRTLREDILARATADTNRQAEEQERLAAAAGARAELRKLFNQEEEKTNALLAFQNKQRRELLTLQKQLDAAGIQGSRRKRLIQEYKTLQAATKAEWEKANAQKYVTDLERKAEAVKDRLITAEQRHAATLVDLKNMLQQNLLTQQQYAAAVKMSANALRAQSGGFSNVHGVMMQASFAVEDFTQVLLMGGGLNMALMSASNNITMLLHSSGMITSVWGTLGVSTIPLVLSGVNALVQSMNNSQDSLENYTSKLTDYFSDLNKEIQRENSLFEFRRQLINIPREVQEIKTLEEAYKRLNKLKEEEIAIEQRRQTVERRESRTIEKMLTSRQELIEIQEKFFATTRKRSRFETSGGMAGFAPNVNAEKLIAELTKEQAEQAEIVVRRRELLAEQLGQIKNIEEARLRIGEYLASISALQGMKEERNRMRALQQSEELEEFAERREKAEQDRVANLKEQEEIERRRLNQLKQEEVIQRQIDAQKLRARQREELFLIKATDEQRERFNLLKGMLKFSDIDSLDFSGQMTAQQFMASQAFLQAQIQATQSQLEKLSEEQQVDPITKGSLEQDAFRAQAEAFKQVFELRTPARNPQIDDTNRKLDTLVDLYRKLRTVVEIVGQ